MFCLCRHADDITARHDRIYVECDMHVPGYRINICDICFILVQELLGGTDRRAFKVVSFRVSSDLLVPPCERTSVVSLDMAKNISTISI